MSALIIIALPTIMIAKFLEFTNDETVIGSIDWVKGTNVTYPNITVCHPSYFSVLKMKSKNKDRGWQH
jgi:hypothetical protein